MVPYLRPRCLMPLHPGATTGVLLAPCRPGLGSRASLPAVPSCYPHSPANQAHCGETLPQGCVHLLAASIYLCR